LLAAVFNTKRANLYERVTSNDLAARVSLFHKPRSIRRPRRPNAPPCAGIETQTFAFFD
jgi:hypothetical protein